MTRPPPRSTPLSLHDALPISRRRAGACFDDAEWFGPMVRPRSEEHTSELQSHHDLVCRPLLEKKNDIRQQLLQCGLLGADRGLDTFGFEQTSDGRMR